MTDATPARFTVDTHVFRQLGELLVGRDATAVVELIKNAYDADATELVLYGADLSQPEGGILRLVDNGSGMTEEEFRKGFLRIAARTKSGGDRRSRVYRRRYTGEKGVGRLAAHKLSAKLRIVSVALVDDDGMPLLPQLVRSRPDATITELADSLPNDARARVVASMDWDLIESVETLDQIGGGLTVQSERLRAPAPIGTTIELSELRHPWTGDDLGELLRRVSNFEPPALLAEPLPRAVLETPLLFEKPRIRQTAQRDPGMRITVAGDLGRPEEYWPTVARTSDWVLEMDAAEGADTRYRVAPTSHGESENQFVKAIEASAPHPAPKTGPFFQARVLLRAGVTPSLAIRQWADLNSGIRIYLEGFRVLPYGEPGNDWLRLDQDYTRRGGRFELDPLLSAPGDQLSAMRSLRQRDYTLRLLPFRNFFGAVFITEEGGRSLRTLVNREGFVPDKHFETLVSIVRLGTDLVQRARALASFELSQELAARAEAEKAAKRSTRQRQQDYSGDSRPPGGFPEPLQPELDPADGNGDKHSPDASDTAVSSGDDGDEGSSQAGEGLESDEVLGRPRGSGARLVAAIEELREILEADNDSSEIPGSVVEALDEVESAAIRLLEDTSLLRVLASVGSQLAAFNHEVAHLLPAARAAEAALSPRQGQRWSPDAVKARKAVADLVRSLERQSAYLVDVVSTDARRRQRRLPLRENVELAARTVVGATAAADIAVVNDVPADLRVPPMFHAELLAVLTNLLTNAVKAAGQGGVIRARGRNLSRDETELTLENTGVAVDPVDGERWFVPYASTSTSVDPSLGQGMGLGLPITRDLLAEYGGRIQFTEPASGFSTAVQVVFVE